MPKKATERPKSAVATGRGSIHRRARGFRALGRGKARPPKGARAGKPDKMPKSPSAGQGGNKPAMPSQPSKKGSKGSSGKKKS